MKSNEIYTPTPDNSVESKLRITRKGKKALGMFAGALTVGTAAFVGGNALHEAAQFDETVDTVSVSTGINSNGEISQLANTLEANGHDIDEINNIIEAGQDIASIASGNPEVRSVDVVVTENDYGQLRVEVIDQNNDNE